MGPGANGDGETKRISNESLTGPCRIGEPLRPATHQQWCHVGWLAPKELCGNGPDDLCSIGVAGIGDLNRWLIAHGVPIREGRIELLPSPKARYFEPEVHR